MTTPNSLPPSEETIFARALPLSAAERAAFLAQACGSDAALRRAVESLLRAHDDAGFMNLPAGSDAPDLLTLLRVSRTAKEAAGDRLGRYKLLQKIGEGGCGTVYMAEQEEPVRRRVALKVIKLGMDTKEVIARFEAERQALAMMDHPNIARVLDAGATEAGRPYFVMELVRGIKITEYCDQHHLPTAERLRLFTQVCHAVQHAHQKGIIHRDLKPSNILVTLHDGAPLPKVIDFGIAKATQGRLTDSTLFTAFEQFIGTPAYMSPEQAQLSSMDVDTRSDIYSLGVLLYELLTGRTPFESKELIEAGLDEMRRHIREVEPPRPSTRLRTLNKENLTTTAQHRHIAPPKLISLINGDLDWIVMRCLEKNRTRRYETAASLAHDLRRHLQNEPVEARPPTALYRLQKMVRRHRLTTTALAALFIGSGLAAWQAIRATRAESAAKGEAQKSRQVAGFLRAMLRDDFPDVLRGRDAGLLKGMLDQAAKRVPAELGDPDVQSDLYLTLGWSYRGVNDYANAEAMFHAAVALARKRQQPGDLADKLNQLAMAVLDGGDPVRAEPLLREALALVPAGQPATLATRHDLLRVLASTQQKRGQIREAAATGRELLASQRQHLGPESFRVGSTLSTFASYEADAGNLALAESMYIDAVRILRRTLSANHILVVIPLISRASSLLEHGAWAEAEPLLHEAETALRRQPDRESGWVTIGFGYLAHAWAMRGDLERAESLAREQLARAEKEFSPHHQFVGQAHVNLSGVLQKRGKREAAEAEGRKALAAFEHTFGRKGRHAPNALEQLVKILIGLARYDEAETLAREALAARRATAGEINSSGLSSLAALADVQAARGDATAAAGTNREAIAIGRQHLGPNHPQLVRRLRELAENLLKQGSFPEAESNLADAWRIEQSLGYLRLEQQRELRRTHVQLYVAWTKHVPAKAALVADWQKKLAELETEAAAIAVRKP
jgi:serine/threonine protein kinase/tetratricopeptide (TPR) repeat protein